MIKLSTKRTLLYSLTLHKNVTTRCSLIKAIGALYLVTANCNKVNYVTHFSVGADKKCVAIFYVYYSFDFKFLDLCVTSSWTCLRMALLKPVYTHRHFWFTSFCEKKVAFVSVSQPRLGVWLSSISIHDVHWQYNTKPNRVAEFSMYPKT